MDEKFKLQQNEMNIQKSLVSELNVNNFIKFFRTIYKISI